MRAWSCPPLVDAWAAPDLDIDENALLERGESLTIDHDIKVLARANRLALHRDPFSRHPANEDNGGMDIVEIPLHCVAHAHPDCRFRWVRITLDLGSNEGVVAAGVTGVIPLIGRHTVKIEKADTLKAQPKQPPAAP